MALAGTAFGQVYKWVDEKGVTHYGESPPQGKPANEIQDKLATPAPNAPRPAENLQDKEREFRQRRIREEAAQEKQQRNLAKRREQCNEQRDTLARLKESRRTYNLNSQGQRVYEDDADHQASIARQEKRVADLCGS